MKKMIIGVASLMMIGLMVGLFQYEKSNQIKLPKFNVQETPNKPQQLQPTYVEEDIGYSLQNDALHITFDQGGNWITVPIEKDQLFNDGYNGDKQRLTEQSYIITEERLAFLHFDAPSENIENNRLVVTYSVDKGNTWKASIVAGAYPTTRFRKMDFISDQFGYVIFTGERVVAQEASYIYITINGGESWELINHPDMTRLVYDGGFVDEMTGFLSVGSINPNMPELHVTQDGGDTWSQANINVPAEYSENFLAAEMPFEEADHLAILVNQGPNGDYKGGRIKGKFISEDHGLTWDFAEEVEPDEQAIE